VEMEASAVFSVGQVRNVETSAVFIISDLLSEKGWKPEFRSKIVLENLVEVFAPVKEVLARHLVFDHLL